MFDPASQNVLPREKVNIAGKVPSAAPVLQSRRVTTVFHEPSRSLAFLLDSADSSCRCSSLDGSAAASCAKIDICANATIVKIAKAVVLIVLANVFFIVSSLFCYFSQKSWLLRPLAKTSFHCPADACHNHKHWFIYSFGLLESFLIRF